MIYADGNKCEKQLQNGNSEPLCQMSQRTCSLENQNTAEHLVLSQWPHYHRGLGTLRTLLSDGILA